MTLSVPQPLLKTGFIPPDRLLILVKRSVDRWPLGCQVRVVRSRREASMQTAVKRVAVAVALFPGCGKFETEARSEKLASRIPLALVAPEPRHASRDPWGKV